jgi:hypothetical protein
MISEFIDRKEEISLLEEEWAKEKGRLIVEWHVKGGDKREYYGIIAQSIEGKEEFCNQGFKVYDLEDFLSN